LLNELREALQQQTATLMFSRSSAVSAFDLQTVLDTLVQSAASLCEADTAAVARQDDGGVFHQIASNGYSSELNDSKDFEMPIVAMPDGARVSFPDDMPPEKIR
jgi:hypothetical protein